MSRSLVNSALLLCLAMLAGCASAPAPPPQPPVTAVSSTTTTNTTIRQWFNRQEQVADLSAEQIEEELHNRPRPESGPELFEFGLLNHYSQHYESWIQARDAFRKLSVDASLGRGKRQMALLLETYNQQRINAYRSYQQLQEENVELQRQIAVAELQKAQLQQQIQALTELEANISRRKDQ